MLSSLLLAVMVAATVPENPGVEEFTQARIQKAFADYTPAICLVTYTQDITDPNSGETRKRDNNAVGLVVSPDGLVLAPGHMSIDNAEAFNINVSIRRGDAETRYEGTLLKKPDDLNVCLIRLKSDKKLNLACVHFAKAHLELGQPLLLVGVLSEALDFARGTCSSRVGAVLEKPRTTYALDSSVRFGFVGGLAVDASGRAVGVVGFDLSPQEGGELYVRSGHPLVYQADLFQRYIDTPPSENEVADTGAGDAWLGVFTQPLNDDFAEYWNLPKQGGVIVSSIVPGSPAETAGLAIGDIIVSFNGTPVRAKLDHEVLGFTKLVRDAGVGKTVIVKWLRAGQPMEKELLLLARPKSSRDAGQYKDEVLGLTVREITTDLRILLNLAEDVKGVIVRSVKSGSVADLAGMRPGVIILNLGDYSVGTIDEFKQAVGKLQEAKPKEVSAFCRAGAATGFFRLEPRWNSPGK